VSGLGLRHDVNTILLGEFANRIRFRAGYIDGTAIGIFDVVQIKYLIIETLQSAFRQNNEFDW
jgi:hypothetical protein